MDKIDQVLTRVISHSENHKGFFTAHIDFTSLTDSHLEHILNTLIRKIITKDLKNKVVIRENLKDIEYLLQQFEEGVKVICLDSEGVHHTAAKFLYANFASSPSWTDSQGNIIKPLETRNHLVPIFLEKNVIPKNVNDIAFKYYGTIQKYILKINKYLGLKGFLLVESIPQILVNYNNVEIKDRLNESISFSKHEASKLVSFLKCEANPLIITNNKSKIRTPLIQRDSNNIVYVLNVLNTNSVYSRREPVSTFSRNEIIQKLPHCKGLLVVTFNENSNLSRDQIKRLNSDYFNIGTNEKLSRSIIVTENDLLSEATEHEEKIIWLEDKTIALDLGQIRDLLLSIDNDLYDIMFRSLHFYKLLSFAFNKVMSDIILSELITPTSFLISGYRGLNGHKLPINHVKLLLQLLTNVIFKVRQQFFNKNINPSNYQYILTPSFIKNNVPFLEKIPKEFTAKMMDWPDLNSDQGKTLCLDYFDIPRYKYDIFTIQSALRNCDIVIVGPFFKRLYVINKRKRIESDLEKYNEHIHPLRNPLLDFELAVKNRLDNKINSPDLSTAITFQEIDLSGIENSVESDHQRFEIILESGSKIELGHERLLINFNGSWTELTVRELYILNEELADNREVIALDISWVKENVLRMDNRDHFDWRTPLCQKAKIIGLEKCYENLVTYAAEFGGSMVSYDWFRKNWLSEKNDSASSPNQKALLKAIGKIADIDEGILKSIHRRKLTERLERADSNRSLVKVLRDYLNLKEQYNEKDHTSIVARFQNDPEFGSSLSIFKKYILFKEEDINSELLIFIQECSKFIRFKTIKAIKKL